MIDLEPREGRQSDYGAAVVALQQAHPSCEAGWGRVKNSLRIKNHFDLGGWLHVGPKLGPVLS
jgi:hypothetical protein